MGHSHERGYWKNIGLAIKTLFNGLRLTLRHLIKARKKGSVHAIQASNYFQHQEGIVTVQYPHETIPVPDTGRYQLHNEIEDCIVCDKCAKICPVDCIIIEPIRAVEEFGKASDGTPKRIYAAKFDIDMGQCCFCGLCTTVCPTESLTMTKTYDFSVFDIREHYFKFGNMTPLEIETKKEAWAAYQKSKASAAQKEPVDQTKVADAPTPSAGKPLFRPKVKPATGADETKYD